jgi:hypothetical protein
VISAITCSVLPSMCVYTAAVAVAGAVVAVAAARAWEWSVAPSTVTTAAVALVKPQHVTIRACALQMCSN